MAASDIYCHLGYMITPQIICGQKRKNPEAPMDPETLRKGENQCLWMDMKGRMTTMLKTTVGSAVRKPR